MATVQMPDGELVELPDDADEQLKERIRQKVEAIRAQQQSQPQVGSPTPAPAAAVGSEGRGIDIQPSGYVGRGEFAPEAGAESAPIVTEQAQDPLAQVAKGVFGAVGAMVPKSLGEVMQMLTLPRPSDPTYLHEQAQQDEALGEAWRGEHGLEEQAKAITGTTLMAAPLIHLPFAERPFRATPKDLSLVKAFRTLQEQPESPVPLSDAATKEVTDATVGQVSGRVEPTLENPTIPPWELPRVVHALRDTETGKVYSGDLNSTHMDVMTQMPKELLSGERIASNKTEIRFVNPQTSQFITGNEYKNGTKGWFQELTGTPQKYRDAYIQKTGITSPETVAATEPKASVALPEAAAPAELAKAPSSAESSMAPAAGGAKLLPGETQGDLLSSTQTEPLALVGEKGVDYDALQKSEEKAKAERAESEKGQLELGENVPPEERKYAGLAEELTKEEEARLKSEYEKGVLEDLEQHEQRGGDELVDAVKALGGLRIDEPHFGMLKEEFQKKAGFSKLVSGEEGVRYKDIFKKNAPSGDALVQALRAKGFDVENAGHLADLLDVRFKTGKKVYGAEARAQEGGISGLEGYALGASGTKEIPIRGWKEMLESGEQTPIETPDSIARAKGEIGKVIDAVGSAFRNLRDFITVKPIPKLERSGLGSAAYEHASARNSVVHSVRHLLSRVFPDEYKNPAAMQRTGDILTKDNILGVYDQAKTRLEDAEPGTPEFDAAAEQVNKIEEAHNLPAYDRDVTAAKNDPKISKNIDRWKTWVNPEMDRMYNEIKNLDPWTIQEPRGRHFEARINLLPLNQAADLAKFTDMTHGMPDLVQSNYRNPNIKADPFMRRAAGTGQYSTDPGLILTNSLARRYNEVTKLRFYNAIEKTGNGFITDAGVRPETTRLPSSDVFPQERYESLLENAESPTELAELQQLQDRLKSMAVDFAGGTRASAPARTEELTRLAIKMPETDPQTGRTRIVEKSLWIKNDLAREARDVLNTDMSAPTNPVFKALTQVQLFQLADAVAHMKNIHTTLANSLGASKPWQDAVRKLPFLASADTVGRIASVVREVAADTPAIRDEISQMAKQGMIRPKYPSTGVQRVTKMQDAIHEVDTASRIVMNRFWDNLAERGWVTDTPAARRQFVQRIGEYNGRLMGHFQRTLRNYGASPFIVAGRTFNAFSKRLLLGDPGFKAATPQAAALARSYQLTGLALATTIPAIINYVITGDFGGRPGTPIGAIDTGMNNEKGDKKIIDVFQLMGIRRGLRATGAGAVIEGLREGKSFNEIGGKAIEDITTTASHPWIGPGLGAIYSAISGKRLDLRGGAWPYAAKQVKGGGLAQYGENLRVTLKNQNPLIYGLVSPLMGETDDTYTQGLARGLLKAPASAVGYVEKPGDSAFETKREKKTTVKVRP